MTPTILPNPAGGYIATINTAVSSFVAHVPTEAEAQEFVRWIKRDAETRPCDCGGPVARVLP